MQRDRAVTIFERSREGRRAAVIPDAGVPERPLEELIPAALLRASAPPSCRRSPSPRSCATTTASRAATSTSTPGFYPLGSCTMKHNPRLNERVAALPGPRPPAPRPGPASAPRARSS